ncbi:YjbE family putative metal transport protein [Bradyrhizobium genosp. L]|uniref:YjbE family putative metal transport protein n=1 Tax=Bradyrhizobium genosp. L TaxID=83637 RepID=UPI0018A2D65B|nr:YjbE family putative metal transport protein [Bradyrhizobium genosp. L]QPF86991.1 YjbE family putative metal transport protein [Bradyrhizobium genosp. L]
MLTQFQAEIAQPTFWLALGKIVWIDILLSGDNALVIAMVCRGLSPRQRMFGMILGAGAAVVMRIALTGAASFLMSVSYLKLVGGLALLVIATKLLAPAGEDDESHKQASSLWAAVGIVMMADATMSIDNIIAIAAASGGSILLLSFGLALSIPLIVAGASLIVAMLDRLPLLVWAGAALLGWIAGEVIADDHALAALIPASPIWAFFGSCIVLSAAAIWRAGSSKFARAS